MPTAPASNTSYAKTAISTITPPARPNPAFTDSKREDPVVASREPRRLDRRADHVRLDALVVPDRERPPDPAIRKAETAKLAASITNAASTPEHGRDEPAERGADGEHRPPQRAESAFAGPRSLRSTRFGKAALDAGSKTAANIETTASSM